MNRRKQKSKLFGQHLPSRCRSKTGVRLTRYCKRLSQLRDLQLHHAGRRTWSRVVASQDSTGSPRLRGLTDTDGVGIIDIPTGCSDRLRLPARQWVTEPIIVNQREPCGSLGHGQLDGCWNASFVAKAR